MSCRQEYEDSPCDIVDLECGPICGNGIVEGGEDCEPPGAHICPPDESGFVPPCGPDCTCSSVSPLPPPPTTPPPPGPPTEGPPVPTEITPAEPEYQGPPVVYQPTGAFDRYTNGRGALIAGIILILALMAGVSVLVMRKRPGSKVDVLGDFSKKSVTKPHKSNKRKRKK